MKFFIIFFCIGLANADDIHSEEYFTNTPCGPCEVSEDGNCVAKECGPCNFCDVSTDRCETYDCGTCGTCKDEKCLDCSDLCEPCSICEYGECQPPTECCDEVHCLPCQDCVHGRCVERDCGPCNGCNRETDRCEQKDCGECGLCKDDLCIDCSDLCPICSSCENGKCHEPLECCDQQPCGPCEDCVDGQCLEMECCDEKPCGPCEDCINGQCVARECWSCNRCNPETDRCESVSCGPCAYCEDDFCLPKECGPCNRCNEHSDQCESVSCGPCAYCEDDYCVNIPCSYCSFCNMETGQCEYVCTESGAPVIDKLYVCTEKCEGCDYEDKEALALRLIGEEKKLEQPECLTAKLVIPEPGQCQQFIHSNEKLGECYNYPIQRSFDKDDILEWSGDGKWSGSFCLKWFPTHYTATTCEVVDGKVTKCYEVDDCKNTE